MLRKFWADISYSGVNYNDISFDSKRQVIFNQLNFLAIATCIVRLAFMGTTMTRSFTMLSFISCIIPIGICAGIGLLNWLGRYDYAKLVAFLLLPPAIAFVALVQKDHGLSIFPLIFCILSFFFLEKKRTIFIAFINSSIWFVTLQFAELLHNDSGHFFSDLPLIIFNHVLILSLVFLLLNFIRKMVLDYQEKLAVRGKELAVKNGGLLVQQREILNKTKMLEERQVQLETANREKNKMMSVISHDLRTPVLSVKNLLELHVKGVVNDAQILQYVPELNREMSNVIDLLENLLAWSKQENREIKSERVELPALVNEIQGVYQFYARSKSVQIVSTVPDHVSVMADRQMIKVVLRNLVSNAIKFSTAGTKVTIQAVKQNDQVSISVADEGQGIAPEILTRILKGEEITTKGTGGEYGSGLGLNLCREFIEKHNSRLQVSSIPGKGSIFSFLLPVLPVETSVVQPAAKEILKPVAILRPVNGKPGRE